MIKLGIFFEVTRLLYVNIMENIMKLKTLVFTLATTLIASQSSAGCFGTSNFYSCYDNSGNSYSVSKFGNSTYMTGTNSRTGSSWSQNTSRIGGYSFTNGTSASGRSWSSTSSGLGTYGFNSTGNSFSNFGTFRY